jgi:hypothetical protein
MIPSHLQNRSIDQLRHTQETIRCFLVEQTGEGYESVIVIEDGDCIGGFKCHRSEKIIRRFATGPDGEYPTDWTKDKVGLNYCNRCGNHEFSPEAMKRASGSKGRVWERVDTGERADNLNDFGPGAMWYLTWYKNDETGVYCYGGPDNQPGLCVRTPGGDWVIDGRASNCALPDDNVHRCWPRRGEAPNITVDKSFGNTCNAGGGSIVSGNYHGFLRNGYLVKC